MDKLDNLLKIAFACSLAWHTMFNGAFGEVHFWDNLTPVSMMVFAGWVVSDSLEGLFKGNKEE